MVYAHPPIASASPRPPAIHVHPRLPVIVILLSAFGVRVGRAARPSISRPARRRRGGPPMAHRARAYDRRSGVASSGGTGAPPKSDGKNQAAPPAKSPSRSHQPTAASEALVSTTAAGSVRGLASISPCP